MYERILIPTDGSDEAVKGARHGIELAAALGSTVHFLYVIEEGGNPWLSETMDDQRQRAEEYGEGIIGEVAKMADDSGVEWVSEVKAGPAVFEKINDYAKEHDVGAIVIGTGYRGTIGGLIGSTAEKVVRSAEVPVISIRKTGTD